MPEVAKLNLIILATFWHAFEMSVENLKLRNNLELFSFNKYIRMRITVGLCEKYIQTVLLLLYNIIIIVAIKKMTSLGISISFKC